MAARVEEGAEYWLYRNVAKDEVADDATGSRFAATIGLLLVPVAAVLLLIELVNGAYWLQHFLGQTDTSAHRRFWESVVSLVVGLVGPTCVAVIWFDPLKTQMKTRLRLALIGYVGCAVAGLAVLIFPGVGSYINFT